jgi:hypothetical protein
MSALRQHGTGQHCGHGERDRRGLDQLHSFLQVLSATNGRAMTAPFAFA